MTPAARPARRGRCSLLRCVHILDPLTLGDTCRPTNFLTLVGQQKNCGGSGVCITSTHEGPACSHPILGEAEVLQRHGGASGSECPGSGAGRRTRLVTNQLAESWLVGNYQLVLVGLLQRLKPIPIAAGGRRRPSGGTCKRIAPDADNVAHILSSGVVSRV